MARSNAPQMHKEACNNKSRPTAVQDPLSHHFDRYILLKLIASNTYSKTLEKGEEGNCTWLKATQPYDTQFQCTQNRARHSQHWIHLKCTRKLATIKHDLVHHFNRHELLKLLAPKNGIGVHILSNENISCAHIWTRLPSVDEGAPSLMQMNLQPRNEEALHERCTSPLAAILGLPPSGFPLQRCFKHCSTSGFEDYWISHLGCTNYTK